MDNIAINISGTVTGDDHIREDEIINYAELQVFRDMSFEETGRYIRVGEPSKIQGWLLHISIALYKIPEALAIIIPILQERNVPFKVARNSNIATLLLSGQFGYEQLGKIISIYPATDVEAVDLAKLLIPVTEQFKGVAIPTDRLLGNCVYTRYGGFTPIIQQNREGIEDKYIYDENNNLVKDTYYIPFNYPAFTQWPFSDLATPQSPAPKKLVNGRYKVVQLLKSDLKGAVVKALEIKGFFKVVPCVIKEGKKNTCTDNEGRDIIDRLKWQFELHQALKDCPGIPKALDYFEINGDGYLVTEFIEGEKFNNFIINAFNGGNWLSTPVNKKIQILDCLLQIFRSVESIHNMGYVHRDLNVANFIVKKNGQCYITDLELSYSVTQQKPFPPFALGTAGYMSAEQEAGLRPTVKEDIYALGALMMYSFTGIFPSRFNHHSVEELIEQLLFFIQNKDITVLISRCLEDDPANRPAIVDLVYGLETYKKQITGSISSSYSQFSVNKPLLEKVVNAALHSLSATFLKDSEGIWKSKVAETETYVMNAASRHARSIKLDRGISGIMLILANARSVGLDTKFLTEDINRNMEWLKLAVASTATGSQNKSLYFGTTGVALMLSRCLDAGIIANSTENVQLLRECLSLSEDDLSIESGLAGQGIALLNCGKYLPSQEYEKMLVHCIDQIIDQQQRDGSWIFTNPEYPGTELKFTGFSNGVAGVVWFLLEYYKKNQGQREKTAAIRGLKWLTKNSKKDRKIGHRYWHIHATSKYVDHWIDYGYSGVVLAYIKGYEVLNESSYKQIAESVLRKHPKDITTIHFGYISGLAGLGEIYLDAAKIFNEKEWEERAAWIANILLHTYSRRTEDNLYWKINESTLITADLMDGNSGLLNFLLRFLEPKKMSFFLSSK